MHQRKDPVNDFFELALYFIAGICFVYFLIQGNGNKTLQAVLIVIVLVVFRVLIKLTKLEVFSALRFSVLFFVCLTMLVANEFGAYSLIPHLDKIEHLLSGIILYFIALSIFRKLTKNIETPLPSALAGWFSLFFGVAMAGCWEMYEFTLDRLFGLHSQGGSLNDTMGDIICGTTGTVATWLYLFYKAKINYAGSKQEKG